MAERSGKAGLRFLDSKDGRVLKKLWGHTRAILRYCQDCQTLEDFAAESMRVEATVFNLMQIGELAKTSLSDAAKTAIPNIPWKQLYGMRNRIVHGYDGVDMRIVWDTVSEDIPQLHQSLKAIIENSGW